MIIKKCITTFCIITAALASGAANDASTTVITYAVDGTSHEIMSDTIVGFSCGTRGKHALIVTSAGTTDEPKCAVTFAYSEHRESAELEQLVHDLHDTKKTDHFAEKFRTFCAIEAAKKSDPTGHQTTSCAALATMPKTSGLIA